MGCCPSRAAQALQQAELIRIDLHQRVAMAKRQWTSRFTQISQLVKNKVINSSAVELTEMLDQGEVTSVVLLSVFVERTINVGVPNNYVQDEMFDEAYKIAEACDAQRASKKGQKCWKFGMDRKQSLPPFFGVPVTIKQTLLLKGKQTYGGFVNKINAIPKEAQLFQIMLRKMGFIIFVRSTVPQGCKVFSTNNNMFGLARNYLNRARSCGGSSGGEGGLIASGCAPMGFGSDIGGSLRIPSEWCGLATIKSSQRFSNLGDCYMGRYSDGGPVKVELGPISRSVADVQRFCEYMYDPQSYKDIPTESLDVYQRYTPFKPLPSSAKFKIGYLTDLDTISCSPSHKRAVEQVKGALEALGHTFVQISLPQIEQLLFFLVKLMAGDGELGIFEEHGNGEPLIPQFDNFVKASKIPQWLLSLLIRVARCKYPRLARTLQLSKVLSTRDIFESTYDNQKAAHKMVQKIFFSESIDAIIMPGFAIPSPIHEEANNLFYCAAYTAPWNVIHYPAGCVSITKVRQDECHYEDDYEDILTQAFQRCMVGCVGMPVGVQVVSLPQKEETILHLMGLIQARFPAPSPLPK